GGVDATSQTAARARSTPQEAAARGSGEAARTTAKAAGVEDAEEAERRTQAEAGGDGEEEDTSREQAGARGVQRGPREGRMPPAASPPPRALATRPSSLCALERTRLYSATTKRTLVRGLGVRGGVASAASPPSPLPLSPRKAGGRGRRTLTP